MICHHLEHDWMPIKSWDGLEWRDARVCRRCLWENVRSENGEEWVGVDLRKLKVT